MDFSPPPRRPIRDSAVPMINVVFLLLIFFVLTATLAERAPLEVRLPESRAMEEIGGEPALYVRADGRLAWQGEEGEAALAGLGRAVAEAGLARLEVRADRALPGPEIARILRQLGERGVAEIDLVVGPR